MKFEWSEWGNGEYPITTCQFKDFILAVQVVSPNAENGYHNRYWQVERRVLLGAKIAVVASGYTMGSYNAIVMCEVALFVLCEPSNASGLLHRVIEEYSRQ